MAVDIDQETAAQDTTTETGKGGWQDEAQPQEPIGTTTPCPQLNRRHRWKGGNTCVRCGATKSDARTAGTSQREAASPRISTRTGAFETVGAMVWAGMGLGIKFQPVLMTQNVKREDGTEVEGKPVKDAVGNTVASQAALAGRRIDRAFHKASPFWYGIAERYLKKATWGTELAPLLIAPMFVYGMAAYPQVVGKFKEQLIGLLLPIFVEQAKIAEQQNKLMQQFEDVNEDTLNNAIAMINALLGVNDTASQ